MQNNKLDLTRHIMIDVETLDLSPTSAVLAIGAVRLHENLDLSIFDDIESNTRKVPQYFFMEHLNLYEILANKKLTSSQETLVFWKKHALMYNILAHCSAQFNPIIESLTKFNNWLNTFGNSNKQYIWANSPSFDLVILKNLYDIYNMKLEIDFRNERDCRTITAMTNTDKIEKPAKMISHNPIHDAVFQAIILKEQLRVQESYKATIDQLSTFSLSSTNNSSITIPVSPPIEQ